MTWAFTGTKGDSMYAGEADSNRMTVLVVDDTNENLTVIGQLLT